jgi:hypothetical protein
MEARFFGIDSVEDFWTIGAKVSEDSSWQAQSTIVWNLRYGSKRFCEIRRTLSLGGGLMSIMKFEIKTDSG